MSLIHTNGANVRRRLTILLAMVACAAPASATQAQATTPTKARRCSSCASRDATRERREQLLLRIDSLRYEFEHERLSEAKRQRLSEEMNRTLLALQASLGEMHGVEVQAVEAERAEQAMATAVARSGPAIAVAIQGRFVTRGYLGVVFDGPSVKLPGRELMIRFLDYPRISMVEPSSPAERAGLQEGDTLLAFNGNDVRDRAISLTKLLVPEQRITVRIKREGNARDFRVKIDTSPDYMINRSATSPMAVIPPMGPMSPLAPGQVRVQSGDGPTRRAPVGEMPPMMPGVGTSVWVVSDGMGGAKLESITEGLGKALGVASGVLVLKVGPGTPAYESGLRDGDVILRAAGQSVRTVRELRAVAEGDREEGVKLVIQRDKRQRELTLRW